MNTQGANNSTRPKHNGLVQEHRDHELAHFFAQDLAEMAAEYERIRARSTEDPGTAGDEGEEVWADLLRDWLPGQYHVLTKGRVLGADASAGPQVDVIVLRPGYPERLLSKKLYLAGGVAAVFECKNTLTAAHVSSAFARAARLNSVSDTRDGSPFHGIVPPVPFGLLAHSHNWKSPGSDAVGNVDRLLQAGLEALASPRDAPTLVCIADTACWDLVRCTYDGPGLMPAETWMARQALTGLPPEGAAWIGYSRHTEDLDFGSAPPNAIAPVIAYSVSRFSHDDAAIRPLSQYFHAAGLSGSSRTVATRVFDLAEIYSKEVLAGLPGRLTNGVWGSDWSMFYMF